MFRFGFQCVCIRRMENVNERKKYICAVLDDFRIRFNGF